MFPNYVNERDNTASEVEKHSNLYWLDLHVLSRFLIYTDKFCPPFVLSTLSLGNDRLFVACIKLRLKNWIWSSVGLLDRLGRVRR